MQQKQNKKLTSQKNPAGHGWQLFPVFELGCALLQKEPGRHWLPHLGSMEFVVHTLHWLGEVAPVNAVVQPALTLHGVAIPLEHQDPMGQGWQGSRSRPMRLLSATYPSLQRQKPKNFSLSSYGFG